jgi:hypothetical protein
MRLLTSESCACPVLPPSQLSYGNDGLLRRLVHGHKHRDWDQLKHHH